MVIGKIAKILPVLPSFGGKMVGMSTIKTHKLVIGPKVFMFNPLQ